MTKSKADWPAIEAEYKNSRNPLKEIARGHGVDPKSIRRKAKAGNWQRPPEESPPGGEPKKSLPVATVFPPVDTDVATLVRRGRGVIHRMIDELDATTSHLSEMEQAIEDETADDTNGKRRAAMFNAISLPTRSGAVRNLATALKTLTETTPGAGAGKKAAAAEAASTAGADSEWGDDLDGDPVMN
jgi:transposase-like protein